MHNDVSSIIIAAREVVKDAKYSIPDPEVKGRLKAIESILNHAILEHCDEERDYERTCRNYEKTITKLKNQLKKTITNQKQLELEKTEMRLQM